MTKLFEKRFSELESQLLALEATKTMKHSEMMGSFPSIDANSLLSWGVKAKSLLSNVCGEKSHHMMTFIEAEKPRSYSNNFETLQRVKAVFLAAKEDYEGGYLNTVRNLVQAEVFGSELEQAGELLTAGYASAAAVIAGVVLETTIRNLCTDNGIDHGKLDKMNADLAKANVYNSIQQKRITAIAGIRNAAAHGDVEKFNPGDVKGMIDDVERFLATTLQ
ncbi:MULTISPECIES: DUF4145 domain-containing protein [Pseudomonas]|uniref:DUF4145 domain-containing protein n=1 Tax=Pseudomonas wuhanensis TaxID=2954098 RepID=A0ABY9GMS0_9PSED|nr:MULTISPECIES: DUF4145 domain-containing protein [unclassified Pseudomonas]WLI11230.1 DUF4145 domain-containing protein [Pseudomonas sp. FP603]WLI17064.1 DUF4145 domain-containing protein [Pseudomonas sp. FP607]